MEEPKHQRTGDAAPKTERTAPGDASRSGATLEYKRPFRGSTARRRRGAREQGTSLPGKELKARRDGGRAGYSPSDIIVWLKTPSSGHFWKRLVVEADPR